MNSNTRRGAALTAVLATAATSALLFTGVASANPTDQPCKAEQLDTTLVAGSPGAGQRYASLQFTAKPGNACKLDGQVAVALTGAPGVVVELDGTAPGQAVYLTQGRFAHVLLHWTGIGAPEQQQRPSSVTVGLPGTNSLELPWNQGPLDAFDEAHTLRVGPVQAGPAEA
ncbi:hypothetical protein JOF53_007307 [Crossiella equi]|uniref:DUF4232 domain-containing protein n=1 Tax=Crossiella equi TaxID=130796 RepID=A0ABS5ARW1_9PSEU|nr:DUF4232 domain-containing protein [Crossiella equi]MBP2478435.1 hypothetical protein [Crossiella equi]